MVACGMLVEGGVQLHDTSDGSSFYNEHQLLQRDLSVAVLLVLRASSSDPNPLTVCDALSGTGVRALRYAVECCTAKGSIKVTANDASTSAAILENRDLNGIAAELFAVQGQDASVLLLANPLQFHYIDLDPFGSPMPYLAAAVTAVADHGVLAVAATDFDVISGKRARACRRLYGANPVPNSTCPGEVALRVLLQAIATATAEQGKHIEPLLCVGLEFCVRVFVRVHSTTANNAAAAVGTVDTVVNAGAAVPELLWLTPTDTATAVSFYSVHKSKPSSDNNKQSRNSTAAAAVYGPLWGGPLYCTNCVAQVLALVTNTETDATGTAAAAQPPLKLLYPLATADRIAALLSSLTQELHGVMLSYSMPLLAKQLGITHMRPSLLTVMNCLKAAGYECSLTHTDPQVRFSILYSCYAVKRNAVVYIKRVAVFLLQ
jgi:tRNA (guanine26-N2/guanine27-N2)-dimethyltransferase